MKLFQILTSGFREEEFLFIYLFIFFFLHIRIVQVIQNSPKYCLLRFKILQTVLKKGNPGTFL